jgi:hypothetical protein
MKRHIGDKDKQRQKAPLGLGTHISHIHTPTIPVPARSDRPVALLCAVILVVSSRTLRNTQREFVNCKAFYMRIMGT